MHARTHASTRSEASAVVVYIQLGGAVVITLSLSHTILLAHTLTHALTRSLTYSLAHSLTNALTHSRTHSLTHSLTRSLTHSLTHTLTLTARFWVRDWVLGSGLGMSRAAPPRLRVPPREDALSLYSHIPSQTPRAPGAPSP